MEVNIFEDGDKPLEWQIGIKTVENGVKPGMNGVNAIEDEDKTDNKSNYVLLDDGARPNACNWFTRWIILEPSIFLFLASARMVYFTRQNLFIHMVCRHMNNMTEAECGNLTQVVGDFTCMAVHC